MKLILSRKGMDSSFGAMPSPILPDGRLCWLPIPENSAYKPSLPSYEEVRFGDLSLGDIVDSLSGGKVRRTQKVHLDPDLTYDHLPRGRGWRPAFGQTGAAERHLLNHGVGSGDLFLFFGWFRMTEWKNGALQYVKKSPDLHVLYGWLQIAERTPVDLFARWPDWAKSHPHVQGVPYCDLDAVYQSTAELAGFQLRGSLKGAGTFTHLEQEMILTAPNATRSIWRLPPDFFPGERRPLTYHLDASRWERRDDYAYLRVASRGQEFVLDLDYYPGVTNWLQDRIFNQQGLLTLSTRSDTARACLPHQELMQNRLS